LPPVVAHTGESPSLAPEPAPEQRRRLLQQQPHHQQQADQQQLQPGAQESGRLSLLARQQWRRRLAQEQGGGEEQVDGSSTDTPQSGEVPAYLQSNPVVQAALDATLLLSGGEASLSLEEANEADAAAGHPEGTMIWDLFQDEM